MKWNALFEWTGKKIHQFADKYWPQPAEALLALQKASDLATEHANKVLIVEAELKNSRASIAELTNTLEESRTSLADKNQELEQLSERSEELTVEVKKLEVMRAEEMDALFDFRRLVIEYLIARQPFLLRSKVTNKFNQVLVDSLGITDDELRDRQQEKTPEEVYQGFLAFINEGLNNPQADPA